MRSYDIVTVGGGLGGSALAKAMAERGTRVLVVERETHFKDRVRGEVFAELFMELGADADAGRARVLPLLVQDPSRLAGCPNGGPEAPSDDGIRSRFSGEGPP